MQASVVSDLRQSAMGQDSHQSVVAKHLLFRTFDNVAGGIWGLQPFYQGHYPTAILVAIAFSKLLSISITVRLASTDLEASKFMQLPVLCLP